jgi:hypothetical protein
MGGQVGSAPGSSMGSDPDISQKYKIDDISKGVATILPKSIQKKFVEKKVLVT